MAFCKDYNARTSGRMGEIIPAEITIFADSSFKFVLKSSPTAVLLRKAAGVDKGSAQPNREFVGKVTRAQVREIAQIKLNDTNAIDMDGAIKQVEGTAHNMGITIVD
jgi:large subunit ribosomal protein L11